MRGPSGPHQARRREAASPNRPSLPPYIPTTPTSAFPPGSSPCPPTHTDSGIVAACCEQGVWNLLLIPSAGDPTPIPTPYTSITWLRPAAPDTAIFLAAAPDRHAELVRLHLPSATAAPATPQLDILTTTGPLPDPRYLSTGQPIDFPSADGRRAYAFFYPPKNDDALPPAGARPPLIVKSHGGPTSAAEHVYDPGVQYWTSRGFAVVDVNYGGSTGHGRAYRESLRGRWGIVDVEDCAAAAEALADRGEADAARLLIRGGSAGGYTTLAALAFKDTFAAGASHYGVADLAALARDTHKFESRYLDRLVGPYPERADLYRERSPLSARDGFSCPVVFFQGDEDRIVPPNQAEAMVEALRARGLPVAYLLFEGEQHGFRRTGNIVRALEAELSFYGQVLGFEPAGGIEPVTLLGPA
ncbi:MAG: prolyl oligopeptidase family serine peptidase [Acidobacteria bacterium]|nr:prolyl oligopeptidase family serine peptidase [Acidobacteriota bacterium]